MIGEQQLVELYISTRLVNRERINPIIYKDFPEITKEFLGASKSQQPSLYLTFSPSRGCEIIYHQDKKCIIYDQYMGQTLNHLNHVVEALRHKTPDDSLQLPLFVYGTKVLAEDFRLHAYPERAIYCALMYDEWKLKIRHFLTDAQRKGGLQFLENRSTRTFLQERFVLCHEISHILAEENHASFKTSIAKNLEYIEWVLANQKPLLEKLVTAEEPARLALSDDAARQLLSEQTLNWELEFPHNERQALALEMTCDSLAASFVFRRGLGMGLSSFQVVEALWLGYAYLWWLRVLRQLASSALNGQPEHPMRHPKNRHIESIRRRRIETNLYELVEEIQSHGRAGDVFKHVNEMIDFVLNPMIDSIDGLTGFLRSDPEPTADIPLNEYPWIATVDSSTGWGAAQLGLDEGAVVQITDQSSE